MKRKMIPLALLLILLTGCGSDAKIKELEARIEKLEQKVGITTEEKQTTETSITSTNSISPSETEKQEAETGLSYLIGDMSASQIFSELCYYFEKLPYDGESYDEIEQSLRATPCSKFYSRYSFVAGCDAGSYGGEPYSFLLNTKAGINEECIVSIEFRADERMDGKVSAGKYVEVGLLLKDFEKASELYYKLLDYLEPKYTIPADSPDYRSYASSCYHTEEGTFWVAQGFLAEQNYMMDIRYIELDKYNDWYCLHIKGK